MIGIEKAAEEVYIVASILPLLISHLGNPWNDLVVAMDASPSGLGVCCAKVDVDVIKENAACSQRWRYRWLRHEEWAPRARVQDVLETARSSRSQMSASMIRRNHTKNAKDFQKFRLLSSRHIGKILAVDVSFWMN